MTSDQIHIVCSSCDASNRVPMVRLNDHPVCGKCRHRLFTGHPLELGAANFQRHIQAGIPVIVDFWAPWCGPCQAMAPVFAQAAQQLEPSVRLGKLNTETEPDIAARFGVRSIPTMIMFSNGEELARLQGAVDLPSLLHWVASRR